MATPPTASSPSNTSSSLSVGRIVTATAAVVIGVVGGVLATRCFINKNKSPSSSSNTTNTNCCSSNKASMGSSCSSSNNTNAAASSNTIPTTPPPLTAANGEGAAYATSSPLTIDTVSPTAATATTTTTNDEVASSSIRRSVVVKLASPRVNPDADHPLILIVCGPSGVGKGTLLQMLQRVLPDSFAKSVSHTTRQPRKGEENGTHYHFAAKDDMETAIANNEFLEYAKVHTNYYGTSLASVKRVQESKRIPILEVDIQGAHSIHHHPEFTDAAKKPLVLFVLPPSFDSLHERLTGRGSETPTSLTTRLETAKVELKRLSDCDFCDIAITNDNLDTAFLELLTSLSRVYPHLLPKLPTVYYETSLLYRKGFAPAVKIDAITSYQWLRRAADAGHPVSSQELADAAIAAAAAGAPPTNAKL